MLGEGIGHLKEIKYVKLDHDIIIMILWCKLSQDFRYLGLFQ